MTKVLFISSRGGHFSELLALRPLFDKYDWHVAVEADDTTLTYAEQFGDKITFMPSGGRGEGLRYVPTLFALIRETLRLVNSFDPDVVVTTGAHTSIPACYLTKLRGGKVVFVETIANRTSKSLSGRLAYPLADLFLVQWKSMLELYPRARYAGRLL
ncbi:MAG TPA: PssD/Cps14F family polysaccharide biosynthesis glycosyltransferase [Coriobacteriia bacterium]|nr:PssD/Cps14F family polysaccharide biosynthesis glycosyltransferase [Coriobacteriia bacterium]